MRNQINDQELETVVGGVVRVNGNRQRVGFTVIQKGFDYSCSYSEAAALAATMYEQAVAAGKTQAEYETDCMQEMLKRGWIHN